jgi:hypothetical protein
MRQFKLVVLLASLGALAGGGCVWLWHGDWSESGNPFAWNSQAQSEFWRFALIGGAVGAIVGYLRVLMRRAS